MSAPVLSWPTFDSADALAPIAPRIGQLICLLGSDRDGEVLAAVAALKRTLAGSGADLHTLAAIIERTNRKAGPAHAHTHESAGWRSLAWRVLGSGVRLTEKETAFVRDMAANWDGGPTERQQAWLLAIAERVPSQRRRV